MVEQVVDVAGARGRVLLRQRPVGVGGADDPSACRRVRGGGGPVLLDRAADRGRGAGPQADAKSVLAVRPLGASSGQQVTVRAVGPDARNAVDALIDILSTVTRVGD